uniref:Large ribosomal subunit protein bL20c n=1 Tax=Geranium phaeum TaxID=379952 RepID=A0A161GP61_9ROSI|nr:ribosomal protein L20 [Geranium phaeum]
MSRTTRGSTAQKHRSKMALFASGARGACSNLTRVIAQKLAKALASAYRDRVRQKRDFRSLWITRINGVIRKNAVLSSFRKNLVLNSYSIFMYNLYKEQLVLNRKMLAQIAISNRNCLDTIYSYLNWELFFQNLRYRNSSDILK